MKRYKLIKQYPCSPNLRHIVIQKYHPSDSYESEPTQINGKDEYWVINKNIIECFPEFWEEIKEEKEVTGREKLIQELLFKTEKDSLEYSIANSDLRSYGISKLEEIKNTLKAYEKILELLHKI